MCLHLRRETRLRDLVVLDLAVDSTLRAGDLVRLQTGELVANATVRHRGTIVQQKAEQAVQFELPEGIRKSLLAWFHPSRWHAR